MTAFLKGGLAEGPTLSRKLNASHPEKKQNSFWEEWEDTVAIEKRMDDFI